ncbi:PGF-pre-PGF domain-containing protein [Methanofollis sp. W23]|uniref:NosD domain-containing protein n=1 Tax=Methanofollis sp. W23 TaxID=2817849 RepID=UPI001AE4AF58|nr:NosD domain-containing protein [Methanofollis sp. W23]MBP2144747.1 PGF-pre-PGF domain-containing protein [Methanofollis sp. W23]
MQEVDHVLESGNISGEEVYLPPGVLDGQSDAGVSVLSVTPSEITQSAFIDGVCTITTPGTYTLHEDVVGTVQISAEGSVVLDGNGHTLRPDPEHAAGQKYGVQVTEGTSSVTIENFGNITGFNGTGVRSMAFRTTTIRNNIISDCGDEPITSLRSTNCQGIYAASQKVVVTSNTVKDCGTPAVSTTPGPGSYGILVMGYDGSVSKNTVTRCGKIAESRDGRTGSYGIYAKTGLTVSDNTVTDCGKVTTSGAEEVSGTGIYANGGIVSGNTVTDSGKTIGAGGENIGNGISGSAGTTIEKNTVINSGFSNGTSELAFGFGIRTEDGSVRDNVVIGCGKDSPGGYGIQSVAGAEVTGNTVRDSGINCTRSGYGIFLNGGLSDLTLTDNQVTDCGMTEADGYGIFAMNSGVRSGSKSVIRNNTITGTSATVSLRLNSVSALTMTENRLNANGPALAVTGGMPGSSRIYNNAFNTSSYFHPDVRTDAVEKYAWNAEAPVFARNIVGGEWIAGNWWGSADGTSGYSDTHSSVKGFGKEAFEVLAGSGVCDAMPLCGVSASGGGELKITGGAGYTYDRTTTTYTITAPGEYWFVSSGHAKPVIIASDDVTLDGGYCSIMVFNRKTPRMTGIFAENRSNIIVKNCQVKYGDVGINVTGKDIVISGNTISGSARCGISTGDATVTDNSVTTKAVGIHGSGIISRNIVIAPVGIEVTREAEDVSIASNTVTSTTTGIAVPSEWAGRATLSGNVIKSEATALEINGGTGSVYNNLFNAETYVGGQAAASYTWNQTPDDRSGRNIVLGKYIAGNYWTNATGNGWSDTTTSETGYSQTPFEVTTGVYDRAPLCSVELPPIGGVELIESGGEGYSYASGKYTITAPGYYYFGAQPHRVSIESDDVVLDGRDILVTADTRRTVVSTKARTQFRNITVRNCYIDGGYTGIMVQGTEGTDVSIIDNTLRNTKSYGIYVKNGVVDGNILTNCAYGGIGYESIIAYDHARVTDNIVCGATKNSIYYSNTLSDGAGGANISRNKIQDGRGHGIYVTGKDGNTTISVNTVATMRHSGIFVKPGTNNPDIEGATVRVLDNTVTDCTIGIDSTVKTLRLAAGNSITDCDTGISGTGEISGNTVQECMVGIAVSSGAATPATITGNRISSARGCAVEVDAGSGLVANNLFATQTYVRGSAASAYAWNVPPTRGENVVGGAYHAGNWWGSPDGTDGYSEMNCAVNGYLGEDPANRYEPVPGVCDHYPLVQSADLALDPALSVADGDVVLGLPAVFIADYTGIGIDRYGQWTWTFTDAAGTDTQTSPSPQTEAEHTFASPGPARVALTVTDRDGQTAGTSRWEGVVGRSALKIGIENIDDGETFALDTSVTLRADVPDLKDPAHATYVWEFVGDDLGTFSSEHAMETTVVFTTPGVSGIRLTVTPGGADAEQYPAGSVVCMAVVTATPSVPTPPEPVNPVKPEIDPVSPDVSTLLPEISVDQQDLDGDARFTVAMVTPTSGEVPKFATGMGRLSDAFLSFNITPENLKDEKHLQYSAVITLCVPTSTVPENEKYNVRVYRFNTVSGAWEALPTTWVKTEAGVHHYEVKTPGFSVFTVVRAVPKAVPNYSDHSSGSDDGWNDQETAVCDADGIAHFNGMIRTVSLGAGASGALVLVDDDAAVRPEQEYYQVATVTIRGASTSNGVNITFCVPDGICRSAGHTKDEIALAHFKKGEWTVRPTHYLREEKGMTYYSAQVPEAGTVAVVYGKSVSANSGEVAANTTTMTVTPTIPSPSSVSEVVGNATPVTAGTPAPTATRPASTPGFGFIAALAGAGAAAMLAGRRV